MPAPPLHSRTMTPFGLPSLPGSSRCGQAQQLSLQGLALSVMRVFCVQLHPSANCTFDIKVRRLPLRRVVRLGSG